MPFSRLDGPILLVGGGKMGGAMLAGWLERGLSPADVLVRDPAPPADVAALLKTKGVGCAPDAAPARAPSVLLLAVKPQVAGDVLPQIAPLVGPATTIVSVMAGKTIAWLAERLPAGTAIVRAMPNTPAAVGRGITVAVPNVHVAPAARALADAMLAATGAVEWIDDEAHMDAVTAVSGSGPAYVFLLAESLARAGEAAGLPADLAMRLARATVAGSGELLHRASEDAATLRKNVTSPGGTTAAALAVLMADDGLDPLMTKAVAAAARRSRELAG